MRLELVLMIGFALPAFATPCAVTRVIDGDTLHMTCAGVPHKVRLLGYDTPEVYHPLCPAEHRAGQAATDVMRHLVASGSLADVRFQGRDRYGRDLGSVQISGRDVAAVMLASGLALPYAGHKHPDWCGILGG